MSTVQLGLISVAVNELADPLVLLYVIALRSLGIVFMHQIDILG